MPDMKDVDFMSNFHLSKLWKNSVKQCILKFLVLNQNSVPSRSVSNKAVSHEVLLYVEENKVCMTMFQGVDH